MQVVESNKTPPSVDHDWVRCAGCARTLYAKRFLRNLKVCPECGRHGRLSPWERIAQLTDADSFRQQVYDLGSTDPLAFVDEKPYSERLQKAAEITGNQDAAVLGTATIAGHAVVLVIMDFAFMGGSMGSAVGELVTRGAELAAETRRPLICVTASGGARMQEGAISLMQMAKTSQAFARLHESGVLSVTILTDPTYGGVTASYATLGSVVIVETGAHVGFAGRRVVEQTIGQELPAGFQTSGFLHEHGLVDRVEERAALRPLLARLLALHERRPSTARLAADLPDLPVPAPAAAGTRDAWETVQLARHIDRPTALDHLRLAFDDFVELHGDRAYADDPAIVAGPARLGEHTVMVVAHQKGHDTKSLVARNFGMPHPEGYRKAIRMFEYAERFGLPVVALVDTPGAYPGVEAEERGQSQAIAQTIMRAARLRVPIVSVITGEGGSGGALALATGDRLLMLENTFYSVISPEGCAAILWRSAQAAPEAARALRIAANDLIELGIADGIVPEPTGGAHVDPAATSLALRQAVLGALDDLAGYDGEALIESRYKRFRSIGIPEPTQAWPEGTER